MEIGKETFFLFYFIDFTGGGEGRETWIYRSTDLCTHRLLFVCAPDWGSTLQPWHIGSML